MGIRLNPPSNARAWYAVAVFFLATIHSQVARYVLVLLVAPIRRDLGISDTQFGLLTGVAFVSFYFIAGFAIAHVADRSSRRTVIGIGAAFWSAFTAACGASHSFLQLFLARLGLGASEAALAPAGISALSDLFPPEKLGRVLAIFTLGQAIGPASAYLAGGAIIALVSAHISVVLPILGTVKTWQLVFMIIAAPGLVIAYLLIFTVPEYRRGSRSERNPSAAAVGIVGHFKANATAYSYYVFVYSVLSVLLFGLIAWLPTLMARRYGVSSAVAGRVLGSVMLLAGPIGAVTGGTLADYWRSKGKYDAEIRVGLLGTAGSIVLSIAMPLSSNWHTMVTLLFVFWLFTSLLAGVSYTGLQMLTPPHLRARATAIYSPVCGTVGMIFGPVFIPLLTDHLFGDPNAINLSMALVGGILSFAALLGFLFGWRAFALGVKRQVDLPQ